MSKERLYSAAATAASGGSVVAAFAAGCCLVWGNAHLAAALTSAAVVADVCDGQIARRGGRLRDTGVITGTAQLMLFRALSPLGAGVLGRNETMAVVAIAAIVFTPLQLIDYGYSRWGWRWHWCALKRVQRWLHPGLSVAQYTALVAAYWYLAFGLLGLGLVALGGAILTAAYWRCWITRPPYWPRQRGW